MAAPLTMRGSAIAHLAPDRPDGGAGVDASFPGFLLAESSETDGFCWLAFIICLGSVFAIIVVSRSYFVDEQIKSTKQPQGKVFTGLAQTLLCRGLVRSPS
eukprot:TRINITY_DN124403_c0_g1_i1.p1 TRINITY_DN124403_c0_g1~~TRINITY_DN124403_c0_g1_i1.p1  ORF type:complete len:101 (-),score=10.67 TRINITY_DN124403_c0_g1_i1:310-612(-)